MGSIVSAIVSFLGGGVANKVAGGVVNAGAAVALVAAITPAVLWVMKNKDDVFVTLTYGETILIAGLVFAFIKMAHYVQAPKGE
jgi:hypothetical protein